MADRKTMAKARAINTVAAKYSKKDDPDPRTAPREAIPGKGGNKRYQGTGQRRQSQQDFTPEQKSQIIAALLAQGMAYNEDRVGQNPPSWYQPEDLEAQANATQPAWTPDPWRMDSPRSQAGGRGPAGLGNAESEYFGPGGGTWMDKLAGHPGGGTYTPPSRSFRR